MKRQTADNSQKYEGAAWREVAECTECKISLKT